MESVCCKQHQLTRKSVEITEFNIVAIYCDQKFKSALRDFANKHNINLLCAPSHSHIPRAERNIRTIKERVRSLFHNLPFRALPKSILKYLVIQTTATLNYFPARYGISQYYSPRMIIHKHVLNYDTHCKHYTGGYVFAHDNLQIKNNMKTMAIVCIYLQLSITSRNVHEFYNNETQKVITRRHCTSVPTPAHIINKIEQQANNNNIPLGITFKPKYLNDNLWLAGVEYDEDKILKIAEHENQDMDINDIQEMMPDPYQFHIPNYKYEPSIQEEQYEMKFQIENNSIENTTRYHDNNYTHNYNKVDEFIMNTLFENPEEEIIFNNNKINEDELDDNNVNENNIMTDQHDDLNTDEENQTHKEPNKDNIVTHNQND